VDERAVCIGTIGARKNQRLLVDALASDELRQATAVFIGDGDPTDLLARARALGVAGRVAVLGYRPHASRYLTLCRALVLPSRNEGLPLAVLEAFRAGVPVVASRIPELAEALDHGDAGYLFEPESAAGLARALREAFDDGSRGESSSRLRHTGQARYSLDRMLTAYDARLSMLLRKAAGVVARR
jgi:glycosyltransferase involved in cell wall biosynthesis